MLAEENELRAANGKPPLTRKDVLWMPGMREEMSMKLRNQEQLMETLSAAHNGGSERLSVHVYFSFSFLGTGSHKGGGGGGGEIKGKVSWRHTQWVF